VIEPEERVRNPGRKPIGARARMRKRRANEKNCR
jgi:hypothetical protein